METQISGDVQGYPRCRHCRQRPPLAKYWRGLSIPLPNCKRLGGFYASSSTSSLSRFHSRLRRKRVDSFAINPSAKAELNIAQLLPFLPVPVVSTLLTCLPLPALSISLFCSPCLNIYICYAIMADPKPEAATLTKIFWQEDPLIPLPSCLSPPLIFLSLHPQ